MKDPRFFLALLPLIGIMSVPARASDTPNLESRRKELNQ
jgi:hypothetical protein